MIHRKMEYDLKPRSGQKDFEGNAKVLVRRHPHGLAFYLLSYDAVICGYITYDGGEFISHDRDKIGEATLDHIRAFVESCDHTIDGDIKEWLYSLKHIPLCYREDSVDSRQGGEQ